MKHSRAEPIRKEIAPTPGITGLPTSSTGKSRGLVVVELYGNVRSSFGPTSFILGASQGRMGLREDDRPAHGGRLIQEVGWVPTQSKKPIA